MKTRIIHTKIHFEDEWFYTLPIEYKYCFIYLFTNRHIGQTGIYELSDRVIMTETQISQELLEKCKKHFFKDKKVGFYKNWICVVNSLKHTNYKGSKNDIAYQKELDSIPPEVLDYFEDTLSIHYIYTRHTTINKKYKIINNKLEIENKKIDDDFLKNIRKEIKDKLK